MYFIRSGVTTPVITLPVETITNVTNSVEIQPSSRGNRLLWGGLATDKREEYISITIETPQSAEAVIFKCKKKTSDDIVAKIEFLRKKAAVK